MPLARSSSYPGSFLAAFSTCFGSSRSCGRRHSGLSDVYTPTRSMPGVRVGTERAVRLAAAAAAWAEEESALKVRLVWGCGDGVGGCAVGEQVEEGGVAKRAERRGEEGRMLGGLGRVRPTPEGERKRGAATLIVLCVCSIV